MIYNQVRYGFTRSSRTFISTFPRVNASIPSVVSLPLARNASGSLIFRSRKRLFADYVEDKFQSAIDTVSDANPVILCAMPFPLGGSVVESSNIVVNQQY